MTHPTSSPPKSALASRFDPRRLALALLLALVPLLAVVARPLGGGATRASGTVGWSTGYYAGWQQDSFPPSAIPWNSLTHLVHFSLLTSSARDGSLTATGHGLTPQLMQAAVAEAHAHGKKILLGVGGAEDTNWDAACNAANRARFVANLVGIMRQYGYDGIDLDIEQDWQSPAHPDYIACVAGIRAALDAITPRPLLTEPGDADWQAYMLAQTYQYLDQINLMDYWRDATAMATGLANYTGAGIPRALLGVGIGIDDGGADGAHPADCAAKALAAVAGGYGGIMIWTVPGDAALHGGQTPCLTALAPFVAPASSAPTPSPSSVPSPGQCRQRFGDVSGGNPACAAIEALASRGVINGCDQAASPPLFCADDTTLREQLAALVVRAMPGWQAETWPSTFTDQTADAELMRRVGTLQHYGVVAGYPDCPAQGKAAPCFGPLDPVLKAQAISFVTRAMVANGYWAQQPTDASLYGGALLGTGHDQDASTYWFYTRAKGGVPDYPEGGSFPLGESAQRGWFARLLWTAIQGTPAAP